MGAAPALLVTAPPLDVSTFDEPCTFYCSLNTHYRIVSYRTHEHAASFLAAPATDPRPGSEVFLGGGLRRSNVLLYLSVPSFVCSSVVCEICEVIRYVAAPCGKRRLLGYTACYVYLSGADLREGHGERRHVPTPKVPSNYKHNIVCYFASLRTYGNVPFKRLALLGLYYFATYKSDINKTQSAVRTTMTEDRLEACILLQVHCDYIPEPAMSLWTIALALELADCILYFKTKWLETK